MQDEFGQSARRLPAEYYGLTDDVIVEKVHAVLERKAVLQMKDRRIKTGNGLLRQIPFFS